MQTTITAGNIGYGSRNSLSDASSSSMDKYPNPFCDIASEYMPSDIYTMFEMAEFLWNTMPPFAEVGRKVVSYFITDFEFEGGTDEERKSIKSFLDDDMKLKRELMACGRDMMVYGQTFVSVYVPFHRSLVCPDCGSRFSIGRIPYKFVPDSDDPHFMCECPKCRKGSTRFFVSDTMSRDRSRVKLVRWSPKNIMVSVHPISGRKKICLDFNRMPRFVKLVREGSLTALKDTPWDIIKAICEGSNRLFQLNEDMVLHVGEPSLAGMDNFKGWSVPPLLSSFKLAFYIQLLRRYDEAFVLDFIIPFRVMYPDMPASNNIDPIQGMPMTQFVNQLQSMVERKRKNITDIQIAPFKIGYQLMGGEGKALSPKDNIELAMQELLNANGYPAEMYTGNLRVEASPIALRLMERRWSEMVDGFNDIITWTLDAVTKHFNWSRHVKCRMRSITLADDLERKAITLQAAAGGDLSKTTAYSQFGIDFKEEQKKTLQEMSFIEKLQQEHAEESEISQLAGSDEGAGEDSPGYSITMDDLRGQAQDLASELLFQVPEGQRRGQLIAIKNTNPTLHALVVQAMKEIRDQMASEGQSMLMEQERQAAMAGQKTASELENNLIICKTAESIDKPSPNYIRYLLLEQSNLMDRDYLRKVASSIRTDEDRKVFRTIMDILDPTRSF